MGKESEGVKEIFNAKEAAYYIGCSAQKVRERMKRKLWDLGEVIPKSKLGNKEKCEYNIYRYKLEKHIGRKLEEVDTNEPSRHQIHAPNY
jgi:hypothetical protein